MAGSARTGVRRRARDTLTVRPKTAEQIAEIIQDSKRFPSPVRAAGAGSGNPRCTAVQHGTRLDMSGMNRLLSIERDRVSVQAGMRLRDLVRELAAHGMELPGSSDQPDRSIGGLVCGGALGCGTADDVAQLSSAVCDLGIVTARGKIRYFDSSDPKVLALFRQSYGLLGVVFQVSLRIRRARQHSSRSRRTSFAELAQLVPNLARATAGVKLYLFPHRDRVLIELREASTGQAQGGGPGWRVYDWLSNRLVPAFAHSVGRLVRIPQLRDPLIDGFSEATQVLVQNRLRDANTNVWEQTGKFRRVGPDARIHECAWLFPAGRFAAFLYAYREFSRRYYKVNGFRCDLPAIVYRLLQDRHALLSPSFDGPVFALKLRSTASDGWDDFLLDFGRFAAKFSGIPVLNLSSRFAAEMLPPAYGARLETFRMTRRQADPGNRLLNQYFAEYIG